MDWIPVIDQQPKHNEPIIYCEYNGKNWDVGIAYWTVSNKWNPDIYSCKNYDGFTHWLSLPKAPNKTVVILNTYKSMRLG